MKQEYALREVDLIVVKGKEEPVAVFEVLDSLEEEQQMVRKSYMETYEKGLDAYRKQNWTTAKMDFETILEKNCNDKAASIYIERINYFLKHPPDTNWNGVWVMKGK